MSAQQIINTDGWYALFMDCSEEELKLNKVPLTGWQIQKIENENEEVKIIGLVLDVRDGSTNNTVHCYDGFFFYYHKDEPWVKVEKRAKDIYGEILKQIAKDEEQD